MNVLRRFWPYIRPYWWHMTMSLLATLLFVAFNGAAYWLSASFLAALFQGGLETAADSGSLNALLKNATAALLVADTPQGTLTRAALAIVIAFLGKNLFAYMQLWYVSFVEQRVIKSLRDELFSKLMRQDLAFFQRERRGDLISGVLNDVEQFNIALNKSFTKLIRDPVNAILVLILLLAVSWKLTLAALIVVPAVGSVVMIIGRKIKKHAVRVQERIADLTGRLHEMIAGIRVVKAFTAEPREADRFHRLTGRHFSSALRQEKLRRLVIPLNEIVGVLIISALLYVGGELVLVRGTMASEDFIRFLVLLFALLTPLLSMGNLVANIRVAEAAGDRVFRLMDSVPTLPQPTTPIPVSSFKNQIRLDGLSFRYSDDTPYVLENINLTIQHGERIAIVGRSGSGKSTLLNLLPRFFDPSEGAIIYDGTDLREFNPNELRKLFGIVTQDVILFHTSIAENIAYGLDDVSDAQIRAAAQAAHANEFIHELPESYNTTVGETGALFSGGQRQRISIARALLRNPEIVLLDEATSALDVESEQAIQAALARLTEGRTVITVTHRLGAVKDSSRIIVLEKGRIVGEGRHDELLKSCEEYRILAESQGMV
ncbi:MAG TPA: ABC transporter ATP-binding protein [Bacteroidetes bacterium]|nr:ABC transporter ATP-binding protein [Bacteroidota bacterium]HEX03770.1 ABC transporter ATP-binding protein [Bacteroidota bacterium]